MGVAKRVNSTVSEARTPKCLSNRLARVAARSSGSVRKDVGRRSLGRMAASEYIEGTGGHVQDGLVLNLWTPKPNRSLLQVDRSPRNVGDLAVSRTGVEKEYHQIERVLHVALRF